MGADAARQIDAELPLLQDPVVTRYIDSLGQAIASHADQRGLEWRFAVVDSRQVNAFALPGGFIYLNRGLIETASEMSELAGVLGHEIGHVTERHSVEQMQKQQKTGIGVSLVCMLTDMCTSDVARVAINVGGHLVFARFSRQHETEADSVAVRHVMAAGIDPRGIPRMFARLQAERGRRPAALEGWFGSHPLEESRIRATTELIARVEGDLNQLRRDEASFAAVKRRLGELPAPPPPPAPRDGGQRFP